MRQHWPRWIKASLNKYFTDALSPTYLYLEGMKRDQHHHEYGELRLDGPHVTELSKGYWQLEVVVDILIMGKIGTSDLYAIDKLAGNVLAAFTSSIPVFQYGNGPDDDNATMLGCLLLCPDDKESIIITNYGQPNIKSETLQQTVEAKYRMNLTT